MEEKAPECCRKSFGSSIKDTAKRLLQDPTIAPRQVAKERMAICESCDFYRSSSQICEQCGCFMPLKTTMSNLKCPIDKWGEHKNAD
jgi:hypothetical protein